MKKALLLAICLTLLTVGPALASYTNEFETWSVLTGWGYDLYTAVGTVAFSITSADSHAGSACLRVDITLTTVSDIELRYGPFWTGSANEIPTVAGDSIMGVWVKDLNIGTGHAFQLWGSDAGWSWKINDWNNDLSTTWTYLVGAASDMGTLPWTKIGAKMYLTGLAPGTYSILIDDVAWNSTGLVTPADVADWNLMAK